MATLRSAGSKGKRLDQQIPLQPIEEKSSLRRLVGMAIELPYHWIPILMREGKPIKYEEGKRIPAFPVLCLNFDIVTQKSRPDGKCPACEKLQPKDGGKVSSIYYMQHIDRALQALGKKRYMYYTRLTPGIAGDISDLSDEKFSEEFKAKYEAKGKELPTADDAKYGFDVKLKKTVSAKGTDYKALPGKRNALTDEEIAAAKEAKIDIIGLAKQELQTREQLLKRFADCGALGKSKSADSDDGDDDIDITDDHKSSKKKSKKADKGSKKKPKDDDEDDDDSGSYADPDDDDLDALLDDDEDGGKKSKKKVKSKSKPAAEDEEEDEDEDEDEEDEDEDEDEEDEDEDDAPKKKSKVKSKKSSSSKGRR